MRAPILFLLSWTLPAVVSPAAALQPLAGLTLAFESDGGDRFMARAGPLQLQLSASHVSLGPHSLHLLGSNPSAPPLAEELLPGTSHYLIGNNPRGWRTSVANYRRVRFRGVYPGIDAIYYGAGRELEFDFVVAPGADPRRIQLSCGGGFCAALREPVIYQDQSHGRRRIPGRFARHGNRLAFEIGKWDHTRPLVIDPVVSFASLIGGGDADTGTAVTVDGAGFIYVLGTTSSGNFPVAAPYQSALTLYHPHLFVAKLNPGGTALVYSTYLGGSSDEFTGGIAIDVSGAVYVGGTTRSEDFPITSGSAVSTGSLRPFAAKLSPDGSSLAYSTFVGKEGESSDALAVDAAGNAFVAHGISLSKLDTAGREAWSTDIGAPVSRVAVDTSGNAYVAGSVSVATLPTRNAFQSALAGTTNAFVAKLDDSGVILYATYLGGGGDDRLTGLAVDATGSAVVAGMTTSNNLPASGTWQTRPSAAVCFKSTDGAATWIRTDSGLPPAAAFTVDPANPRNVYALAGGRLYKTIDSGANWMLLLRERSIAAFAVSRSAPMTAYVLGRDAQGKTALLKSIDGGLTWSALSEPPFASPPPSPQGDGRLLLTVDAQDPLTLYGGVGGSMDGDGVFKSTDGGATWTATSFSGAMHGISSLTAAPAGLFAASGRGIFSSRDGGENWELVRNVFGAVVADPRDPLVLYTAAGDGVHKSTDGGRTFSLIAGSPPNASALNVAPANPSTLYVHAFASPRLFRSTDAGAHWAMLSGLPVTSIAGLAVDASTPPAVYISTFGDQDGFVARLSPAGSDLVYATYLGGRGFDSVAALALGPDGSAYIAGSSSAPDFPVRAPFRTAVRNPGVIDGFVAKLSADGTALLWSGFLGGATPAGLALAPGGGVYVTGASSSASFPTAGSIQPWAGATIYRSTNGGARWIGETPNGLRNVNLLAVHPKTPSRLLAVSAGDLYLSTDSGASWNRVVQDGSIGAVVFDPIDSTTAYAEGSRRWLSTNGGLTWGLVSNGFFPAARSLAIDPKNPATLYAATGAGLYKSTNRAASWTVALPGNFGLVRIDPQNPATLFAVSGATIRKSTDGGGTWAAIGDALLAETAIQDLQVDPNNSTLYAGTPSGMFRSSDGGTTWNSINQGLRLPPGSGIAALAVDKLRPGTIYAAVVSGGVFRSSDRGDTWTRLPLEISKIQALAVDPTNSLRLYAGALQNPSDAFVARIEEER